MGSLCEQYLRSGPFWGLHCESGTDTMRAMVAAHAGDSGEEVTNVRVRFMRILCASILVLLMLPLDASAAPPTGTHKIVVDSKDVATLKQLTQSDAKLLVDYGAFSLWKTNDSQRQAVSTRPSVNPRDDYDLVHLRGGNVVNTVNGAAPIAANVRQSKASDFQFWIVQFIGPVKPAWLANLRKLGIEIVAYMPNNAYVVWLDGSALTQLENLAKSDPTVQWTDAYHPSYRLAPTLQNGKGAQTARPVPVTVQLYRTTNTPASLASLRALGGKVLRQSANVLNFTNISLEIPANQLAAVAARPDVFNVEPYAPPKKKDEVQDQIIAGNVAASGGNVVPTGPGYRAWLQSKGFTTNPTDYPVVDVVDDGIDDGSTTPQHPDFYQLGSKANPPRLVFNNNCTTDTLADGQAGHGNLNAGIVAAYNDQNGFPYTDGNGYDIGLGVSPYGRVAGTKIFDNGTGNFDESACDRTPGGGPGNDADTVLAAYSAGANITSNSWGSNTAGGYDAEAQAYDALTRDASSTVVGNQEMLHVFSAGNAGLSGPQTVGSPGTAKNVLTVGATENVRDNGVADGCGVAAAASADNIANFSSRGPTVDGRNKPDVVAPGTHVRGPASQDFQGGTNVFDGSGVCGQPTSAPDFRYYPDGQTRYTWSSGTSHSAPAVAGVASLVYNYYGRVINPGQTPSPAMLKALILNSPRYLTGIAANDSLPSPNQGWGDVDLGTLFDSVRRYTVDETTTFTQTGETFVKAGNVASHSKPFRVTLVWTDAPGSTTGGVSVNDLDLEVTVGGQVYRGNHFSGAFSSPGGSSDTHNNVESVFLPAETTGPFSVRVVAANIAGQGVNTTSPTNQDFALVVTNANVSATVAVGATSITATDAAPNGNGNGIVEPGEKIALTVGLVNSGNVAATGVTGTLFTANSGVTITNATSAYSDLPAIAPGTPTPVNNAPPFTFTVNSPQACGTQIAFKETVSYNGGFTETVNFTIPVGAPSLGTATSYSSTDVPKPIPDYNDTTQTPGSAASNLPISASGSVGNITAEVSISHNYDSDLIIKLISPNGAEVVLSNRNGGSSDLGYTETVFDDHAAIAIFDGTPPFTGRFKPEEPLSQLIGTSSNGTWMLKVTDNASDVDPHPTNALHSWSLTIQPTTFICAVFVPPTQPTLPTVTSINPTSGDKAGGTTVTIKGTNFGGTTSVMFGDQPATNVMVVNSTTITAVTPMHVPGAVPVKVTTNGLTLTLSTQYTYGTVNPAPSAPPPQPAPPASGSPVPVPSGRSPASPVSNVLPAPAPPKR